MTVKSWQQYDAHYYYAFSHLGIQGPESEPGSISSFQTVPFKRARSATLQGDDEAVLHHASLVKPSKRQWIGKPSQLRTPSSSSPLKKSGKARADTSSATEAAIREIPKKIKKAIRSLEMIAGYVDGLLEFKGILDCKQLEVYQMLEEDNCGDHSATRKCAWANCAESFGELKPILHHGTQ